MDLGGNGSTELVVVQQSARNVNVSYYSRLEEKKEEREKGYN